MDKKQIHKFIANSFEARQEYEKTVEVLSKDNCYLLGICTGIAGTMKILGVSLSKEEVNELLDFALDLAEEKECKRMMN